MVTFKPCRASLPCYKLVTKATDDSRASTMEGYTVASINSSFSFQGAFQAGFSPGVPSFAAGRPAGPVGGVNPQQIQRLMFQLMSAIQQLAGGYQGFGGHQGGMSGGMPFGGGGGFPGGGGGGGGDMDDEIPF